jgi:hypothetical protein
MDRLDSITFGLRRDCCRCGAPTWHELNLTDIDQFRSTPSPVLGDHICDRCAVWAHEELWSWLLHPMSR